MGASCQRKIENAVHSPQLELGSLGRRNRRPGCIGLPSDRPRRRIRPPGGRTRDFTVRRKRNPFSSLRVRPCSIGAPSPDAPEEQKFADYYNQAVFPNVTNPANRQSPKDDVLTKLRIDLKTCERAPAQHVFNKLADLTLAYMTEIAKDEQYHPAARVDAMLVIGEVNSPKAVASCWQPCPTRTRSMPSAWQPCPTWSTWPGKAVCPIPTWHNRWSC